MKIRYLLLVLMAFVSGLTLWAQDDSARKSTIEIQCKIIDATKPDKNIPYSTFYIYSLPDSVKVEKTGTATNAGITKKRISISPGKYTAKVFVMEIAKIPENQKSSNGVTVMEMELKESDEYEPKWVDFEITANDLADKSKSIGTVELKKKNGFKAPKPVGVKHSK